MVFERYTAQKKVFGQFISSQFKITTNILIVIYEALEESIETFFYLTFSFLKIKVEKSNNKFQRARYFNHI